MYIVLIAWLYVTVMMALAEASNSNGTVLGAIVTLVLYGLLPVGLLAYLMGAPARRRAIRRREAQSVETAALLDPDAGSHASAAAKGNAVAPVRKEP